MNQTPAKAGWTLGFQKDGRELLIVAIKATFDLPPDAGDPVLSKDQAPLVESDEFTGEPGFSATRYESDYAHRKPFCDVLVNGSAYAPHSEPAKRVTVGLYLGPIQKRFQVVGERAWDKVFLLLRPTPPRPFVKMPISYDRAYGGTDKSEKKPDKAKTYLDNPVGVGFYPLTTNKALVGKPLPNTCEIGSLPTRRKGKYRPMSFSPLGRNFKCRRPFTGTYDDKWLNERAPFFPDDFDYRYFQCAPADQQMPHPKGGEQVGLENLTPDGVRRFRLPTMPMPVLFVPYRGEVKQQDAVIDTVLIEPDKNRFMLTWRANLALRRNCFEIHQVVIGKTEKAHRRESIRSTKTHYKSLEELIQANKARRGGVG
ncbi:MAG TPA: DUF2169 domain-containing protein [Verrucomicrobiae bacterium]